MRDAMKEWTTSLGKEFSMHVVDRISPQCLSHLKAIRGMPGMFRASQRDMPTSPSFFVSKMFAPLQDIVGSPDEYGWMEATLQYVTAKYVEMTHEMLRSVRKTDESLRKLLSHRKTIAGSGSSSAAIGSGSTENLETSDSAKIQRQLELDAHAFGEHLKALGIPFDHIPQYQEFRDLAKFSEPK
jgi:conserved oligomeric Golgi complex subunit 2